MPKSPDSGPYTKAEREKRRNEVYRLHFEYGYSARKISELMKINRNTINGDLNYWYTKIRTTKDLLQPEYLLVEKLERLEIQRTRLREAIDKDHASVAEKITLERLIFDVDSKIINTYHRFAESFIKSDAWVTDRINDWMKKNRKEDRYVSLRDMSCVSEKTQNKINEILKQDRMRGRYY
ncbi:MAG: hypothetical protein WD154_08035 [Nitrosopumilaceae archaeon]